MEKAETKEKTKNSIRKEFFEIYRREICPILKDFEAERKKISNGIHTCLIIGPIFCIVLPVVFLALEFYEIFMLSLFGFVFIFGIILIKYKNQAKSYALVLKNRCLAPVLRAFGNISWQNNKRVISDLLLDLSQLFACFNRRTIDDEFFGEYKGISFKVSETKMAYESGSGKNRNYINVFSGVILTFTFDKNFSAHTMVSTKGDLTSRNNTLITSLAFLPCFLELFKPFFKTLNPKELIFPLIIIAIYLIVCLAIQYKKKKTSEQERVMQKINLEDVKFNKKFEVYSQDQIEGRCYVTPAFMERFLNLNTAFGAKKAKCAFFQNQIMFAISTKKNLFEISSINKSLLDFKTFENFYKEISAIYEIIDYFKLETKS